MIKINFNQKKTANKQPETKGLAPTGTSQIYTQITELVKDAQDVLDAQTIFKAVFNFVLVLAFPLGLKIYEITEIRKLKAQKAQEQSVLDLKNQELASLKKELSEYDYLKEAANEFQKKRDSLRRISIARLTVPRVMDFVQNQTPEDVIITNLKVELRKEEGFLSLSGFGFKEASINYFTNNLEQILRGESIVVDTRDVKEGQSDSIIKTNFNLRGSLI